jgi:hypothetical protein
MPLQRGLKGIFVYLYFLSIEAVQKGFNKIEVAK